MNALMIGLALLVGCSAHAHTNTQTSHVSASRISVSAGWAWVPGHWAYIKVGVRSNTTMRHHRWISGHWKHEIHGKSHRTYNQGPPSARPHRNAYWVKGHWEGRGHHRQWVSGHWKMRR